MEGYLLLPPDRGTIIGRAIWKTRYVVIGPARDISQPNLSLSQVLATTRSIKDIKDINGWASKPQQRPQPDGLYLSVYKTKDDWEAVQQHSVACITDCQVQMAAHRKQGHVLPTLAVHIARDPVADKLRKRRSSRTAGFASTKESGPTTLWFRLSDDNTHTLADWARYIHTLIQASGPVMQPMSPVSPTSPMSPTSPTFINPFASHHARDSTEYFSSTSSGKGKKKKKAKFQAKSASQGGGSGSRDPNGTAMYNSESPSLRSRHSDISSKGSSMVPNPKGYVHQHYTTVHPSDLPSPATTVGEYPDQFIEGWTSAQGRSSTLSSPVRARASTSSSHAKSAPSLDSSSPPAPRETILDRAFQLRCIPGSDREVPGEEHLSSLARFEALMREAEERQKSTMAAKEPLRSTWEEDDEEDQLGADAEEEEEEDEEDSDEDAFEQDMDREPFNPSASRALQFITNRHSSGRPPWSHHATRSTMHYGDSGALSGVPSILRPHTAHSRSRPAVPRAISQPQIPFGAFDVPGVASARAFEEASVRRSHEKRHSTSDVKTSSFNEFTKRLSSTSSLLLVQSNASTGSSRGSSDIDNQQTTPRAALSPRGGNLSPSEREERCRWRGSVGVFGSSEGGFL